MAKRRGHGEGSIHLRDDGRWCAVIDLGIINGKRKRKYIYGETRKAVQEQLRALQREQEAGVRLDAARQSVKQFLERWIADSIRPHRRPKTVDSYVQIVQLYLVPAIGHHALSALTPAHVQSMINALHAGGGRRGQPLSAQTISHIRSVLRKALGQAVKWGLVARNVATLVEMPEIKGHAITPLSPQQAQALLAAVRGYRLEALYRVALSLGLRKGEIIGLRWTDIDLDLGVLRVAQAIQRTSQGLTTDAPKTRRGVRTLLLPEPLVLALCEHRARLELERREAGALWNEHDLAFPSDCGTPLEPRNLSRHFKAMLSKAGLPETIRFHDLRHSCATLLIAQGVHPRVVMEILGHSQISVTMNTYSHVLPETQREAAAKLAALLETPEPEATSDCDGALPGEE
jgi:integrase